MDLLDVQDSCVITASRKRVLCLDLGSGKKRWQSDLSGKVLSAQTLEGSGHLLLTLSDGTIELCENSDLNGGRLSAEAESSYYFNCDFDLTAAAGTGDTITGSSFAVVSADDPSRVSFISCKQGPSLESLPGTDDIRSTAGLLVSPSGTLLTLLYYDEDGNSCALRIDPSGKEAPKSVQLQENRSDSLGLESFRHDRWFLSDSGLLILNGTVYDLEKGSSADLVQNDENIRHIHGDANAASCITPDGSVQTAAADWDPDKNAYVLHLYQEGELSRTAEIPYTSPVAGEISYCACEAQSPQGTVLLSMSCYQTGFRGRLLYDIAEDRWIDATFLGEGDPVPALGESHAWAAMPAKGKELYLYDLSELEVIPAGAAPPAAADPHLSEEAAAEETAGPTVTPMRTIQLTIPGQSVSRLLFFRDDTRLAVFCSSGDLFLYDTKDGSLLNNITAGSEKYLFEPEDRYEIRDLPDTGRTLFLYEGASLLYPEPICIAADSSTFGLAGIYPGVTACNPSQNLRTIVHPLFCVCPESH